MYRKEQAVDDKVFKVITQKEATDKSWSRFQQNLNSEWGLAGADTGIHDLNMMIGGWVPGKVTTIAARSGMGKTATTTQMFQAGERITSSRRAEYLFFTWEMAASYLVDRHVCNVVGITNKMLTQGAKLLDTKQMGVIKQAYGTASILPVTYQQISTNIDIVKRVAAEFVKRCMEKSKVEGVYVQPVVVIDYIGMAQFDKQGLRTYGIGDFMTGCKNFANETGAAFCIFAQINRSSDQKELPDRADLSDSQSIENASDNLLLLHRPEYYGQALINRSGEDTIPSEGKAILKAWKGRDLGTSEYITNCDIKYSRFWSEGHNFTQKYWELYEDKNFWIKQFGLK
jgi:replicative DNA helicase